MDYHQHARLTVFGRKALAKTAAKWVRRYRMAGFKDRSSRPQRLWQPTSPDLVQSVEALRRELWTGQRIALQTASAGRR